MFSTFTEWVDSLLKAAGHKYIKRVPYTANTQQLLMPRRS